MKFTCIMFLFIHLFLVLFRNLTPKAKYFCEWCKTKKEFSQVLGRDYCDLRTHCDRKSWWQSEKGDMFPRGVIVSVFHNAQRGDTSLVKHSLFIEYRWEKGKKCTDLNPEYLVW